MSCIAAQGAPSVAGAQSVERVTREIGDIEGRAAALLQQPLRRSALRSPTYVEERLTNGELYFRMEDYLQASIIFSDIVDNYPQHRAYPDALFQLGESLFHLGDYFGARTRFREVLTRANESGFQAYTQQSLGRLIEIAIHVQDFEGVDAYFQRLSQMPSSELAAHSLYFRAKYLYSMAVPSSAVLVEGSGARVDTGRLEEARLAFAQSQPNSPYRLQSQYFIGVIHALRAEYPQAIEAFRQVLRSEATTREQRSVVDLTYLALGRLYYETDQIQQSVEAYQSVPRTSEHFEYALYEIAWAYIRMGDSIRAERALEVLAVAAPNSHLIPDAQVLRGNLLLRNGRFDDANAVFLEVRGTFAPVLRELEDIRSTHADLPGYFRQIVRENLDDFDATDFLPRSAQQWVELGDEYERAITVVSDLNTSRRLIRETEDLIVRLNGALAAPNGAAIFSDLRDHLQAISALQTRLSRARQGLIEAEARSGSASPEVQEVRAQRRRIEEDLGRMPVSADDFIAADDVYHNRYRRLRRELRELEVQVMGLEAQIVATERFMADTEGSRQAEPEGVETELAQQRTAVEDYRTRINQLRRDIEIAELQVGVGDARYERDEQLRTEYAALVARERQLTGGGRSDVDAALQRISDLERRLVERKRAVAVISAERIAEIRVVVDEEAAHVVTYRESLAALEGETEEVIGVIAHQNFMDVRDRFYDMVLRADVGRVDVAWAEREEHRLRVDMLTRERQREMQVLDDEFSDIMDTVEDEEEGAQ
ncbi:MAG: tetratricopeptide repeat protein [Polyangiales bacterium]